jgi:signal recognition particle GTPase
MGTTLGDPRLEPGWLLDPEPSSSEATPRRRRSARPWRSWAAEIGGRLRAIEQRTTARLWTRRYPLAGSQLQTGLPEEDLELLQRAFRRATPARVWRSQRMAQLHLESLIDLWRLRRWEKLRGVHVILGSAGAGKTTLALKAASRLRAARRRVGIISLLATRPAQQAALAASAAAIPLAVETAADERELERALDRFALCDVVLIDTPCVMSDASMARRLRRLPLLQHPRTVLHYSLCLHHARAFRDRELALANAMGVDFLALSHLDLAPGPGALLSLQLHTPQRLSLVNPGADAALVSFDARTVLQAFPRSAR